MLPTDKLKFEEVVKDGKKTIALKGVIDEDTNFTPLLKEHDPINLNFSGVSAINSCGIRTWVNFLKENSGAQLTFIECPPLIVRQMNMVPSFIGKAKIESVFATYICESCEDEKLVLIKSSDFENGATKVPETIPCEKCKKGEMEFDGSPKQYFAFSK